MNPFPVNLRYPTERSFQLFIVNAGGKGTHKLADGRTLESGGEWHAWRPVPHKSPRSFLRPTPHVILRSL